MSERALRVLMLAHNQAEVTVDAVRALLPQLAEGERLLLLDNASEPAQGRMLSLLAEENRDRIGFSHSPHNLGFAAGMNRLIAAALAEPSVQWLLLLNNDAVPAADSLRLLHEAAQRHGDQAMVAAALMKWDDPAAVDSLGITLYRSGLASNRKHRQERLLGPTGGCMLLSRRLLEDLHAQHGYWFDERFFCYAEDTDLVMRARWLGYDCVFADDAQALHHGSLSSGGPDNTFVLYHGIRNSIWALAKNAPALWLLAHLPWMLVAHAGVCLRNLRKGRWRTLWRLYADAARGLPAMWRERRTVRRSRRLPARAWWRWVEPRLYERDYLRKAWRELWRRGGRAGHPDQ